MADRGSGCWADECVRRGGRMKSNMNWSPDYVWHMAAMLKFLHLWNMADFWLLVWESYTLWIAFVWSLCEGLVGGAKRLAAGHQGSELHRDSRALSGHCSLGCNVEFSVRIILLLLLVTRRSASPVTASSIMVVSTDIENMMKGSWFILWLTGFFTWNGVLCKGRKHFVLS